MPTDEVQEAFEKWWPEMERIEHLHEFHMRKCFAAGYAAARAGCVSREAVERCAEELEKLADEWSEPNPPQARGYRKAAARVRNLLKGE